MGVFLSQHSVILNGTTYFSGLSQYIPNARTSVITSSSPRETREPSEIVVGVLLVSVMTDA
jgi:hypothetical protein